MLLRYEDDGLRNSRYCWLFPEERNTTNARKGPSKPDRTFGVVREFWILVSGWSNFSKQGLRNKSPDAINLPSWNTTVLNNTNSTNHFQRHYNNPCTLEGGQLLDQCSLSLFLSLYLSMYLSIYIYISLSLSLSLCLSPSPLCMYIFIAWNICQTILIKPDCSKSCSKHCSENWSLHS